MKARKMVAMYALVTKPVATSEPIVFYTLAVASTVLCLIM